MNIAGPDLPTALFGHSMVTLGLGQAILGGQTDTQGNLMNGVFYDHEYERKIYFVSCYQLICGVSTVNQEISAPRGHFIAIPIPDSISGCVSKGKFLHAYG